MVALLSWYKRGDISTKQSILQVYYNYRLLCISVFYKEPPESKIASCEFLIRASREAISRDAISASSEAVLRIWFPHARYSGDIVWLHVSWLGVG